jgi:3-dehydroquinate synthase
MTGSTVRVPAAAAQTDACDVVIRAGALSGLGPLVAAAAPAARYAVLAPRTVAALYGAQVLNALHEGGLRAELLEFADGEASKTRQTWAELTDAMLERGFGRDCCVLALGGGVAGDIAGFVAATYMRGVPVVQLPTTLLAMVDASVGGKTGVDTAAGKNLVGAFHAPRLVVMDPMVLQTLPEDELRAGLAEALKHGAILDADYFRWIAASAPAILAGNAAALEQVVARSVELKAAIVAEDPFEHGRRAILNFGHTVGHALELASGYTLLHGFAVALGMLAEAAAGEAAGITEAGTGVGLAQALDRCGLPVATAVASTAGLLDAMTLDKKARHGTPRLTLLQRIGACAPDETGAWTHALPPALLAEAIGRLADNANSV